MWRYVRKFLGLLGALSLLLVSFCVYAADDDILNFIPAITRASISSQDDGIVYINQAKILSGNITSGDAAGFPATISKSGHYKLTSDIIVPGGGTGIMVSGPNDVVFDLNGYSVSGGAYGISAENYYYDNSIEVANGSFKNFSATAVDVWKFGRSYVHNILVKKSNVGIVGMYSKIDNCTVGENVETGIVSSGACSITNNAILGGNQGIKTAWEDRIVGNIISTNTVGIEIASRSDVRGNTINVAQTGIALMINGLANVVKDNTVVLRHEGSDFYVGDSVHNLFESNAVFNPDGTRR